MLDDLIERLIVGAALEALHRGECSTDMLELLADSFCTGPIGIMCAIWLREIEEHQRQVEKLTREMMLYTSLDDVVDASQLVHVWSVRQ